jgi:hypothetical protein
VIRRVTGEFARLAEMSAAEGRRGAAQRPPGRPEGADRAVRGQLRRALDELAITIERTAQVIAQARSRLAETMSDSATRLGWSAGTAPIPVRSARAASTAPSSSGTRPRSPTTTTA